MNYTPLHVHTDASSDGLGTVEALVNEAKRIGCTSLACTDHGTLANAVAFWTLCNEKEIKPILGMEAYLSYEGTRHHLTLLSLNEDGFNNLIHLSSHAHAHGWAGGYPLMTLDDIQKWKGGLQVLTGCASSAIHKGSFEDGLIFTGHLVDIMGRDHVSAELMFVGTHNIWSRPLEIAAKLKIHTAVTNDSHYPCQHQFEAHQVMTTARKGFTYDSRQLWLKSADEILFEGGKFLDRQTIIDGLNHTQTVARAVEPWNMKAPPTLPKIDKVEEILGAMLRTALKQDIAQKGQRKLRIERLQYEFHIFNEKKFFDYIYILHDIVSWAKAQGIYVGPGRGSGGGSYVLYLLGITTVDPLEYDLLFERFINPSRSDYPDVDMDFESDRRGEVVEYAHNKWDAIPIANYNTYSHKSVIHDIARVLKIPKTVEIPAADSEFGGEAFNDFTGFHEDALGAYDSMMGQIRHRGKHAGGVIITDRPVPLERAGDELVVAWAEGINSKDLSKVGIVKYDILGLTALSQLKMMVNLTGQPLPDTFDDPEVYDLFQRGDVAGIFQWAGSDGIRQLTIRIQPKNFHDLATINALYRPGALDAGTAEKYPDYMANPRKLHPRLDRLLEETYGVICYQEQMIAVFSELTGQSYAQADDARRIIVKSKIGDRLWEADVQKLHDFFVMASVKNNFDRAFVDTMWDELFKHSRYSFNKAHAVGYTIISYQMAWFKVHYRPAFTTAMLQYDRGDAQTYIFDAVESGLSISTPHINVSDFGYVLQGDTIYIPLNDVSHLGEKAAQYIIDDRQQHGPYVSYEDFNKRIPKKLCNSRVRVFLQNIGAFEGLAGDPASAIPTYASLPVLGPFEAQLEALGYVIPTDKLLKAMKRIRATKRMVREEPFVGFVTSTKDKMSAHGAFKVFYLSPFGSFWLRGHMYGVQKGSFVSGIKNRYGHATKLKIHKLD
jgi:DNA polymerase-3 subunit alpha